MRKETLAALLAILVIAASAAMLVMLSEDPGEQEKDTFSVNLNVREGDTYTAYQTEGNTLREALETALGEDIVISNNGNIRSYKGTENTEEQAWVVFKWDAVSKWVPVTSEKVYNRMELVLMYSVKTVSGGRVEYEKPTLDLAMDAYFFIQIPSMTEIEAVANDGLSKPDANNGDLTVMERFGILQDWLNRAGIDTASAEAGFWIKGSGSNVNEALVDAVHRCLFSDWEAEVTENRGIMEYRLNGELVHSHLTNSQKYGWFVSFLGWTDTSLPNGDWTYWSQFAYNPNANSLDDSRQWTYNTLSLGLHDMTKYRYFALILQTTTEMDAEQGIGANIPVPSEIPEELG